MLKIFGMKPSPSLGDTPDNEAGSFEGINGLFAESLEIPRLNNIGDGIDHRTFWGFWGLLPHLLPQNIQQYIRI